MAERKTYNLKAQTRTILGKKTKTLRSKGLIPAVIYGRDTKPQVLSIDDKDFEKIFVETGTSTLVDLIIDDGAAIKVLTHEPQYDPVKGSPIHIDFYKVRMDEKIKTEIPLEFVGESEAVEQLDGSLVTNRDNVEVECLPADLVSEIQVNISELKTFEDSISVKDLAIPQGIEVLTDSEEVIAVVEPPRSEEELAELEESAAEEEKEAIEQMGAEAEGEEAESETEGEETGTGKENEKPTEENQEQN